MQQRVASYDTQIGAQPPSGAASPSLKELARAAEDRARWRRHRPRHELYAAPRIENEIVEAQQQGAGHGNKESKSN